MNEMVWRRLEKRLVEAHVEADPPLSRNIWRGVEAALAARPTRRGVWLAMGVAVLAAAAVALWFLPVPAPVPVPAPAPVPVPAPAPAAVPAPVPAPAPRTPVLNQVLQTRRAITFAISADAGTIEIEPCRGRFVNVTLLDGPHRTLELIEGHRRVEARFDGRRLMDGGVAHILVPADTHLIISARTGPVVVRGLGGPMEIDTRSGDVAVDTAHRLDPAVTVVSDGGAITWSGRCGRGCRVEARSRSGDITLRAPDRAAFTRGAARGESQAGRVHLEELTCTDPRCSSSPLPWRQPAAGKSR
jgi:hypothetical protein